MYRFTDIVGHEFIIKSLKKALAANRIAHAYVFDGGMGAGKKLMANVFAKTLLCEAGGPEPCNECISCRAFDDGNNPDIIYIYPSKGQVIGVDDIREQVNKVSQIKPYKYRYKVFILDGADDMTVQAQNALLKTLEEPPTYAVFLLISTNFRKFLPTIISRCIIYRLKMVKESAIEKFLINKGYNSSDAVSASALCGGHIGKALELLSEESFISDKEEILSLLNGLPDRSLWDILLTAKSLDRFKENPDKLLDMAYIWYRDALVCKSTLERCPCLQHDITDRINFFSRRKTIKELMDGIESVKEARANLRHNGNYLLTMEVMLMKMAGY